MLQLIEDFEEQWFQEQSKPQIKQQTWNIKQIFHKKQSKKIALSSFSPYWDCSVAVVSIVSYAFHL